MTVKVRAIGQRAYDALLGDHPPTKKQKDNGDSYNIETFCPALISQSLVEPSDHLRGGFRTVGLGVVEPG